MPKILLVIFLLFSALILAGCSLPFGKGKKAALQITSSPKTTVFLDGEHLGATPFFDEKIKPGEYTIKLVPEASGQQVLSWEGRVELVAGVLTVISRDLGETEETSSGYVLSLERKTDKESASIAVVTDPDGAVVSLDGEPKGFAPLSIDDLQEGENILAISSPGFVEKTIKAKTIKGYKLIASIQLAKMFEEEEEEEEEASPSAEIEEEEVSSSPSPRSSPRTETSTEDDEMERPYVKIKETGTGWLNVRTEPSTAGKEETIITKIYPGEVYRFIESNSSGWYKIEHEEGESGWISGKYAELYK